MLEDLYRQVIMDHYRRRRNFEELTGENTRKVHYKNPTCGDIMTLFLDLEQDQVKKATFLGEGCSISMASASMMTELIQNKSLKEVALHSKCSCEFNSQRKSTRQDRFRR